MNLYNQNVDKIHNFQVGSKDANGNIIPVTHKYGDRGAGEFNRLHRAMYGSLNGANGAIGYDDKQEDIYGSSTWLRDSDQYEKAWKDLTPEEK